MRRRSSIRRHRQVRLIGAFAVLVALLIGTVVYRSMSTSSASLAAASKVLQGPAAISVIGDSTGNDGDEWVSLWAADLGQDRTVRLERWLDGRYRPDPLTIGTKGDPVTIWNASEPGAAAGWATSRLVAIEPEQPDLVILNFGHNNTESNIAPQLDGLLEKLNFGVPVVLILQNPGRGDHQAPHARTLRSAQSWANAHHVPTINVTAAFDDPASQMRDDIHPSEAGSRAWASAVEKALGT